MEVLSWERVSHSFFHLLKCLINTASELREWAKVTGSKVWTIGTVRNCLDAHLCQIVCDKDGVVDWCIVLNLLCHSNTDARFMQDAPKAVWSIPHISVAFFPSLKRNFIVYSYFKVSDCIFETHQLWQSGFSRVYSNCCCSCSFEPEIIKIGQSSHKMNSNNILTFQESMTILHARTKKLWKLIECNSYKPVSRRNNFLKAGVNVWSALPVKTSLSSTAPDWELFFDLDGQLNFPDRFVWTQHQLDIILVLNTIKKVIIWELSGLWEEIIAESHMRKLTKY